MRALIMFVAPIVAAVATATILNKKQSIQKGLPHYKNGIRPVGNARFGDEDCPSVSMTFSQIGYSRDHIIIQL